MKSLRQFVKYVVVLAGLSALSVSTFASEFGPQPPKAKQRVSSEQACVEPIDDIRKNHMEYLLHKRDETLREGVRTKQHSLVECIDCHVTPNEKGEYARIGDDKHFCSSCHNYAAVKVDCFDCHSDLPQNADVHMHSLTNTPAHHPKLAMKNGELTKETLDALTSGGKQ